MTLDDLPFDYPSEANPAAPKPKCRHERWKRDKADGVESCRCGHVFDAERQRKGRLANRNGRDIQRKRIVGLGGKNLTGNKPNHDGIGLMFSYESKSGREFSEAAWRLLKGIPVTAEQIAVLILTHKPGSGHKARSYVVVDYDDWRDLHGEQAE